MPRVEFCSCNRLGDVTLGVGSAPMVPGSHGSPNSKWGLAIQILDVMAKGRVMDRQAQEEHKIGSTASVTMPIAVQRSGGSSLNSGRRIPKINT